MCMYTAALHAEGKAEWGRAEWGRAEWGKAEWAGQHEMGQGQTVQGKAEQSMVTSQRLGVLTKAKQEQKRL